MNIDFSDFSSMFNDDFSLKEYTMGIPDENIPGIVSKILSEVFQGNTTKQEIKERDKSFNFACPYCGDSHKNDSAKRGHIFKNDHGYKCYNCGVYKDMNTFLSDFGMDANNQMVATSLDKAHGAKPKASKSAYEAINGVMEYAIPKIEIMRDMNWVNVVDNIVVLEYLRKRKQIPLNGVLDHFACDKRGNYLVVFNLAPNGNVIGLQLKILNPKPNGARFVTYKYSDIWKKIFKIDIDDIIKTKMDRISMLYNILSVDYTKDVYIFEGSIDSHHIPNSVATWSASSKLYLKNGLYFYDNSIIDDAGKNAAIEMIKKGYRVFLWRKFMDENPRFEYFVGKSKKCKDLNDLIVNHNPSIGIFKDYFSNDQLDLFYI